MKNSKFYITTPLYYSNDRPHVGSAYTTIAADVLARWYRAEGRRVYFQTGLDEHGAKMAKAAEIVGFKNPQEFCDHQVSFFQEPWRALNITYNRFFRTTEKEHQKFVQDYLSNLYQKKEIYQGTYQGLYCLGCEEFKELTDLIEEKCSLHNSRPQKIKEKNYFFRLSKYQSQLIKLIERDEMKIEPKERKNEILGFLKKEKLTDISISREKVEWGIPVPWDKQQTIYCWVDALMNYLSAGQKFWPADLHLIGKDILKFHAVLWPALLLAGGEPPPKRIFAHGFFTLDGKKISKTQGNIIYIDDLLKKYQSDVIRYVLLREIPFGADGDFSEEGLKRRYNADLANNLGNLVRRVTTLLDKAGGELSGMPAGLEEFNLTEIWQKIGQTIEKLEFDQTLDAIWQLINRANKYIEEKKPWEGITKKNKEEQRETKKVLANLVGVIREIAEMLLPFMPETAEKLRKQFQGPEIKPAEPLFPRLTG